MPDPVEDTEVVGGVAEEETADLFAAFSGEATDGTDTTGEAHEPDSTSDTDMVDDAQVGEGDELDEVPAGDEENSDMHYYFKAIWGDFLKLPIDTLLNEYGRFSYAKPFNYLRKWFFDK